MEMATKPTTAKPAAPRKKRKLRPLDKPKRDPRTRKDGEIHGVDIA
jgi:hypothetical protein